MTFASGRAGGGKGIVAFMTSTVRLRLFNHVVNPGMRTLIRHRPHGRMANAVALLSYQGRVSGRSFTIPVEYARDADGRYVIVPGEPEHKTWWKNFRTPMTVRVLAAGSQVTGQAELIAEPAERSDALAVYFRRFPAAARMQHLPRHDDGRFDQEKLTSLAEQLVVIRVSPSGTNGQPGQS
jgi:deazaflavin-dependent oxidoreductase (nitroreductase family)